MVYLKFLILALFGLAAIGSGLCTLLFLPSLGQEYVGWLPPFFGLPVFVVSAMLTWLVWRSLRRTAAENPKGPPP